MKSSFVIKTSNNKLKPLAMRALFIATFLFFTVQAFAEIKPKLSDYNCQNSITGSSVSFDLTMIFEDEPLVVGSGVTTLVKAVPGLPTIGTISFNGTTTLLNYPVSFQSTFTCEDLLDCEVGFTGGGIPYTTFPLVLGPPIPTLSQWAIFLLGLCLTTLAIVTIRKKVLAV